MRGVVWGEGVYVMDGRGFGGMVCMFVDSLYSIFAYIAIPLHMLCLAWRGLESVYG